MKGTSFSFLFRPVIIAASLLLLLAMLAYPFSYDQSVFAVGGDMAIKHGAVEYRDFIDTKPPVIFWIYGIVAIFFGHHEWSIRAFDILYHIIGLSIFYRVLKNLLRDERIAAISVLFYAVIYSASGFLQTAQTESFALLPSILFIWLTNKIEGKENIVRIAIISGILGAFLFLLKFTLVTVPLASVLYLLLHRSLSGKQFLTYLSVQMFTFMMIIGLFLLYLQTSGAMQNFLEAMKWLKDYSSGGDGNTIQGYSPVGHFKLFPYGLLSEFGFTFLLMFAIGCVEIIRRQNEQPAYTHLFLQCLFGLLAIYYEGKSAVYHFARLLFAAVPIIAFGIAIVFRTLRSRVGLWSHLPVVPRLLRYLLLIPVIGLTVFYTPFYRLLNDPYKFTSLRMQNADIGDAIDNEVHEYYTYHYSDEEKLRDSLSSLLQPDDNIFFWGRDVELYYHLDRMPTTIMLTSQAFHAPEKISGELRSKVLSSLRLAPPRFVISEFDDSLVPAFFRESTIECWPELYSYVQSNYDERPALGQYRIFEKK